MAKQLEFTWSEATPPIDVRRQGTGFSDTTDSMCPLAELRCTGEAHQEVATQADAPASLVAPLPLPAPLPDAIEAGVFGVTEDGPINPDDEAVAAITEEHAREMLSTLADMQAVEEGLRTGHDPRTGRTPRTPESRERLAEFLAREKQRLQNAYGDALAAYAQGFGDQATAALDRWVRMNLAGTPSCVGRYDPGHPWHYLPEGDNAPPIPVDEIEGNSDIGRHIETDLPKNRTKRIERMREMLGRERERVEEDRRRYQEIVERGAEALSRYDREIAHTCDAMARATALSLKYNHIRFGLGRIAWLEATLGCALK